MKTMFPSKRIISKVALRKRQRKASEEARRFGPKEETNKPLKVKLRDVFNFKMNLFASLVSPGSFRGVFV